MKKSINILILMAAMLCGLSCGDPVEPDTPSPEPENPAPKPEQPVTPSPDFESQFQKHIALWEFTGAWCANCPKGYTNMNFILTAYPDFTDYVHPMAFHSNKEDTDDLAIEQTYEIMNGLKVISNGFPSYSVDMMLGGSLVADVTLTDHLYQTIEENPAYCGVAVSSSVDASEASVNVKLHSEIDASWRVGVYVVEDKVKYHQNNNGKYVESYTHRHVVRRIVSASYKGDRIGGKVTPADTEISADYKIDVDPVWNLENTYVYVLAIDSNGYVNNMNHCLLNGGVSDYKRK